MMIMMQQYKLIEASLEDIPILVQHYRRMFEEILDSRNLELDEQKLKKMDVSYRNKLNEEFRTGICKAWVIKEGDQIAASGAISITSMVPNPDDSSYYIGYLHSIFTENQFRKRGLAERVVRCILDYCKSNNINRVLLNTSEAGRSVYDKIGFINSDNTMIKNLKT
jgi:N-acetylglutamate synthase-like GNAT family acetyltransferase